MNTKRNVEPTSNPDSMDLATKGQLKSEATEHFTSMLVFSGGIYNLCRRCFPLYFNQSTACKCCLY